MSLLNSKKTMVLKNNNKNGKAVVSQKQLLKETIEALTRKTHFDRIELGKLAEFYLKEICSKSKLSRLNFHDFLHRSFNITDIIMMDQVFKIFDKDNDGQLNLEEFAAGMSLYLRGTIVEQTKFCFEVYDLNCDGFVSREEVTLLLKKSIVRHKTDDDPEETFKELIELVVKKLDKDGDHRVSELDFQKAVEEERLLMQCLGTCLPNSDMIQTFEATIFKSS